MQNHAQLKALFEHNLMIVCLQDFHNFEKPCILEHKGKKRLFSSKVFCKKLGTTINRKSASLSVIYYYLLIYNK